MNSVLPDIITLEVLVQRLTGVHSIWWYVLPKWGITEWTHYWSKICFLSEIYSVMLQRTCKWYVGSIVCQCLLVQSTLSWGWYDLPHCCCWLFPLIHAVFCSVDRFVLKLGPSPQEVPFVITEWRVVREFACFTTLYSWGIQASTLAPMVFCIPTHCQIYNKSGLSCIYLIFCCTLIWFTCHLM